MSLPPRWASAAAAVAAVALMAGCVGGQTRPQLEAVHSLATTSAPLTAFAALSLRYRDTYGRELPYLSAPAVQTEKAIDASRRAAYADIVRIQRVTQLYLQTLGQLSAANRYALADQARKLGNGIKAWPGSGLDDQDVAAYTVLARIVTQTTTGALQQQAVNAMLADGGAALQTLFGTMLTLLRLYDKNNDNEQRIVLGLFEVNLPFAETGHDRLLATLAQLRLRELRTEYATVSSQQQRTATQLRALASAHAALLAHLARPADAGARLALTDATRAIVETTLATSDAAD